MTPSDYNLTDAELPAVRQFLSFQQTFGPGIRTLVPGDWQPYCDGAAALDAVYSQIQNPLYKSWLDQFFSLLVETPTNAVPGQILAFKHMYIVYAYGKACKAHIDSSDPEARKRFPVGATNWANDMWIPFTIGYSATSTYLDNRFVGATWGRYGPWGGKYAYYTYNLSVPRRPSSPIWTKATEDALQAWGSNPPAQVISRASGATVKNDTFNQECVTALPYVLSMDEGRATFTVDPNVAWTDGSTAAAFADQILARWADFPDVQTATAPVWAAQTDATKALLREATLTAGQYFFLLNLLLALATGDGNSQALARKIAEADAPSKEFANSNFSDQLIYLVLMDRANPLGDYAWANPQLQQFLNDISNTVTGSDLTSQAIKAALTRNLKILHSDPSYPMQDPYAPSVGLDSRLSHTLDALDAARAKLLSLG
ncbi:MAG: hypothetical protein QOD12_2973 [Verrucomicrobiota bacterium]|jgi:hypothetical protein